MIESNREANAAAEQILQRLEDGHWHPNADSENTRLIIDTSDSLVDLGAILARSFVDVTSPPRPGCIRLEVQYTGNFESHSSAMSVEIAKQAESVDWCRNGKILVPLNVKHCGDHAYQLTRLGESLLEAIQSGSGIGQDLSFEPFLELVDCKFTGFESQDESKGSGGAGKQFTKVADKDDVATIPKEFQSEAVPRGTAAKKFRPGLSENRARAALNEAMASGEINFIEQSPQRIIFDTRQINLK